jgi:hypothetical protein
MLAVYWRDGPVWMPFLFAAFFGFLLWTSLLPQAFGPEPNYSKPIFANGRFGERRTEKSLYAFAETDGHTVYLSCWPRMRVNSCIDDMTSPGALLRVEFAPMKPSIFRSESGVVLGLWRDGVELLNPETRTQHLTRHINRFNPLGIFLFLLGAFPVFILSVVFLSIVCGMIEGMKRMIRAAGHNGRRN